MNNTRRSILRKILEQLEEMAISLSNVLNDEMQSYNSLPDGLKDSERGFKSEDCIENLGDATINLRDAIISINTATS